MVKFGENLNFYVVDIVDGRCMMRLHQVAEDDMLLGKLIEKGRASNTDTFLVLGLPFLHRYCAHYDATARGSEVRIGEKEDARNTSNPCTYTTAVRTSTYTSRRRATSSSSSTGRTTTWASGTGASSSATNSTGQFSIATSTTT